jgi:hypothetical protein
MQAKRRSGTTLRVVGGEEEEGEGGEVGERRKRRKGGGRGKIKGVLGQSRRG